MKEERPFDPEDFIPADAAPAAAVIEDEPPRGIAGALLGAAVTPRRRVFNGNSD